MLSIANEVDTLIFRCICFVCDTNMCFSNSFLGIAIWKLKYVWKYKSCLDPQIKNYGSIDFTQT